MYGLITRLTAHPGRRDELGLCLLDPNVKRPGCHSYVVAHDVKGDEIINRFPNALGLEMEIFGFFKAIELAVGAKPAMMAVKGVADFGDGSKHKLFQPLASRLSYCVASEIISNYFNRIDGQSKK